MIFNRQHWMSKKHQGDIAGFVLIITFLLTIHLPNHTNNRIADEMQLQIDYRYFYC